MKNKLIAVLSVVPLLTGCSEIELKQFFGSYSEWYTGLDRGVVQRVNYDYRDHLIESVRISCDYYVKLDNGKQLKFSEERHAKESTCRYEENQYIDVEVYEDNLGNVRYSLIVSK